MLVVFALLLLGFTQHESILVAATTCPFCLYGKISDTMCTCTCIGLYLPPSCSYTASENVTITLYANMTIDSFRSQDLLQAIGAATSLPTSAITYGYATNLSQFDAIAVQVQIPGYVFQRLTTSIAYQDPWVIRFQVISAYPVVPSGVAMSSSTDMTLYTKGYVNVTVAGIVWLGACVLLCAVIVAVDWCMFYQQDRISSAADDEPHTTDGVARRRSLLYQRANEEHAADTKEMEN